MIVDEAWLGAVVHDALDQAATLQIGEPDDFLAVAAQIDGPAPARWMHAHQWMLDRRTFGPLPGGHARITRLLARDMQVVPHP